MTNRRSWALALTFTAVWCAFHVMVEMTGRYYPLRWTSFLPPPPPDPTALFPWLPQPPLAFVLLTGAGLLALWGGRRLMRGEPLANGAGPWPMFALRVAGVVILVFFASYDAASAILGREHEMQIVEHLTPVDDGLAGEVRTEEGRLASMYKADPGSGRSSSREQRKMVTRAAVLALFGAALIRFPHRLLGATDAKGGTVSPEPITNHQLAQCFLRYFGLATLIAIAATFPDICRNTMAETEAGRTRIEAPLTYLGGMALLYASVGMLASWLPRRGLRMICGEEKLLSCIPTAPGRSWYAGAFGMAGLVYALLGAPGAIQRAIGYYSESSSQETWQTASATPPLPWLIYYLAAGLTLILLARPFAHLMAPNAPEGLRDE